MADSPFVETGTHRLPLQRPSLSEPNKPHQTDLVNIGSTEGEKRRTGEAGARRRCPDVNVWAESAESGPDSILFYSCCFSGST